MLWLRICYCKSLEPSKDRFRRGGSREGPRCQVVVGDVGLNSADQVLDGTIRPAADDVLLDQPELSFDPVEPGAVGRRVVDVMPWVLGSPSTALRVFVRRVVVEDLETRSLEDSSVA